MSGIVKPTFGTPINRDHPLSQGLIAAYEFNEHSGDIVHDYSGNNFHGNIINSPEWVPNVFGGALDFIRASNQYVEELKLGTLLGDNVDVLSVSFRIKADDVSVGNQGIFSITPFTATNGEMDILLHNDGNIYFRLNSAAFNQGVSFSDETNWHHIVFMYTGSAGIVYLDNSKEVDTAYSTNLDLNGLKTVIAGYYNNVQSFRKFDGKIDQVKIYNRVLTIPEIALLGAFPYSMYEQPPIWMLSPSGPPGLIPTPYYYQNLLAGQSV